MAQFVVLTPEGKLKVCDCVRIAKKSLIMAQEVDGSTQVRKELCFYYDKTKTTALATARRELGGLKARSIGMSHLAIMAMHGFKNVTLKSTRL